MSELAPLLVDGTRIGLIVGTVFLCFRWINSTWTTSAATLRESADYAREENEGLRARVEGLEEKNAELAAHVAELELERATWTVEKGQLEHRIRVLETRLTELVAITTGEVPEDE